MVGVILLAICFHHGLLVIMSRLMRTGLLLKLVEKLKKNCVGWRMLAWKKWNSNPVIYFSSCFSYFIMIWLKMQVLWPNRSCVKPLLDQTRLGSSLHSNHLLSSRSTAQHLCHKIFWKTDTGWMKQIAVLISCCTQLQVKNRLGFQTFTHSHFFSSPLC